ncbi:MAG: hypothetical protein LRY25_00855 [Flavobacterium sp.]|nr:hypothetical protein [Flavobacterium sp.]
MTIVSTTISQIDKTTDLNSGTCGDILKFRIRTVSGTTTGNVTYNFINNQGQNLSVVNVIPQAAISNPRAFQVDFELPQAFF